jgi:NAD(P) transhydrogenase subunit alpha
MQLVIPRETQPGENRVSATPETVKKLVRLGAEVVIEAGAGTGAGISDSDYEGVRSQYRFGSRCLAGRS